MKIVHVIASLHPRWGGPPAVATGLAAAQAAKGARVWLVTYRDGDGGDQTQAMLDGVPGIGAVELVSLPAPNRIERVTAWRAARFMRGLVADKDYVHLHGVWDPILRVAASAAQRAGVAYAIAPQGMLDPWSLARRAWKKRLALRLGYRRMLDGAAVVQKFESDEQQSVVRLGLRCPTEIIPNGVFLEQIEPLPPRGTFSASWPALGGRPFVLFLGRLHFKKGLDLLAEALALAARTVPELQLVVAGPDFGEGAAFSRRIERLGLPQRVHRVGPLYGRAKYAAMVDACCFCLPSRQEGFSMAVLECMACGTPVVISEACHFEEAETCGAGTVVPLAPAGIARAIVGIAGNPARREAMGDAARRLIQRSFTWRQIAGRTLDAYARHQHRSERRAAA
jgi:glycosyltransferase involved in cell wall biosynthesis